MADSDVLQRFRGVQRGTPDDLARSAAVEALTEIILDQRRELHKSGGKDAASLSKPPSATEYFASLMMALQGPFSEQHDSLVFLLSVALSEVPRPVLRLKGEACVETLLRVLRHEEESATEDGDDSTKLSRHCLTALSKVLAAQEPGRATWDRSKFFQALNLLVRTTADARPKVRKTAQHACEAVLQAHAKGPGTPHKVVCQLASSAMKKCSLNECATIMRLLSFCVHVAPLLVTSAPFRAVFDLTKQLTRLLQLGHVMLSTSALKALQTFVEILPQSRVPQGEDGEKTLEEAVDKELLRVCNQLAACMAESDQQRHFTNDPKLCGTWVATLQRAEAQRFKTSKESRSLVPLAKAADAFVSCMSAGMRLAGDRKVSPLGQPQVALSVGALSSLVKMEVAVCTDTSELIESLEPLLGPQFEESWPLSLEILRAYFAGRDEAASAGDKAQTIPASVIAKEKAWIQNLGAIREAVINPVTGADKPKMIIRWRGAMERLFGTVIASMGPEFVLGALPLETGGAQGLSPIRLWLVPLLREHMGTGYASTKLAFFRTHILPLAEKCENASQDPSLGPNSARTQQMRFMQLWSLLPGFCLKPEDVGRPEGLRALAPVLGKAMSDERFPELTEIVCQALQNIVAFVRKQQDGQEDEAQKQKSKEEAAVVEDLGRNFLPLLFNQFDELAAAGVRERADYVLRLISVYALAAPSELVNTLFRQLVQQLLEATKAMEAQRNGTARKEKTNKNDKNSNKNENDDDEDSEDDDDEDSMGDESDDDDEDDEELDEERQKMHSLTSLALALVPALDDKSIGLLYRVVQPYLQDEDEPVLQKRGYRVLEAICEHHVAWTLERHEELIQLLQAAFYASSPSTRTARLKTMRHVIRALASEECDLPASQVQAVFGDMLGEVVLCTKETNNKARSAGYKLIIEMAHALEAAYAQEEASEPGTGLRNFLHMAVGGLAAQTPHMRSAALNVCCRFYGVFFREQNIQKDLLEVAQTALLLLQEKHREIAKSAISFAKVCTIRLPQETLTQLVPTLVENLAPWMDSDKNRYKLRIRVIFERMLKRVDPEIILECGALPADHKMLTYIRKQASYKRRRYERRRNGDTSVGVAPGKRRTNNDGSDDDSDLDDMEEDTHGRSRRRNTRTNQPADEDLIMDEGGEALDLLGASALSRVKARAKASALKAGASGDSSLPSEFKMSSDGRIIVPNDGQDEEEGDDDVGDVRKRRRYASDDDSEDEEEPVARGGPTKNLAALRAKKSKMEGPGGAFKSKKSGGDVKKKQSKFEPFAYIKLDPKLMNRRRKHDSARQFRGLSGKRFKLREGGKNRNEK